MDLDRVKDVLFEAMALPEAQRDAFIDKSCDGPTAERVRELLAAHAGAPHTAEADAGAADASATAAASIAKGRHPDQIAGRKILRTLGEGGYGLVFLAEEREPISRKVAIKVIRPGHHSSAIAARFESERRVLAAMNHPAIAQVYEAGSTGAGPNSAAAPYVVMEYVDGRPITEFCKHTDLPIGQRVELIERACHAVQHAHQKGVIHRDIKPSNVLVYEADGRVLPKVIDFGIAKAIEGRCPGRPPT